jgi:hypothetical protein
VTTLRLQRLTAAFSALAVAMYAATLVLGTKRHPYLMYSGLLSAATGIWAVRKRLAGHRRMVEDGFEYLDAENAEVVKDRILGLRDWVAATFTGIGFVIAVVGGYGEGFVD